MMMFCGTLSATNKFVTKKAQEVWPQGESVLENIDRETVTRMSQGWPKCEL